eukprot:345344-Rhodomonas_salina.1
MVDGRGREREGRGGRQREGRARRERRERDSISERWERDWASITTAAFETAEPSTSLSLSLSPHPADAVQTSLQTLPNQTLSQNTLYRIPHSQYKLPSNPL